jgi:hypothetical protein
VRPVHREKREPGNGDRKDSYYESADSERGPILSRMTSARFRRSPLRIRGETHGQVEAVAAVSSTSKCRGVEGTFDIKLVLVTLRPASSCPCPYRRYPRAQVSMLVELEE